MKFADQFVRMGDCRRLCGTKQSSDRLWETFASCSTFMWSSASLTCLKLCRLSVENDPFWYVAIRNTGPGPASKTMLTSLVFHLAFYFVLVSPRSPLHPRPQPRWPQRQQKLQYLHLPQHLHLCPPLRWMRNRAALRSWQMVGTLFDRKTCLSNYLQGRLD